MFTNFPKSAPPGVQIPWSDFLKSQSIKPLTPTLSVNRLWTKWINHALKSERVGFFFNICPKKAILKEKSSLIIFLHVLSSLQFSFTSCFCLISPWISASMVVMEEMRLIFLLGLYMFLYMLVKHLVGIWALFLQFYAYFMRVWDIERGAYGVMNRCMDLVIIWCWVCGRRESWGSELKCHTLHSNYCMRGWAPFWRKMIRI